MEEIKDRGIILEHLGMLCAKYHRLLKNEDVSNIDTLFGIVWQYRQDHQHEREIFVREDIVNRKLSDEAEISSLIEELNHIYERLKEKGISIDDARKALWALQPISRLCVGRDMCLNFQDYGKKVRLTQMPFSIYVLFLRHKDGIVLKDLPEYCEELYSIYLRIYGKRMKGINDCHIREMIMRVTTPSSHAMMEYISRIHYVIQKSLDSESIANNYYIKGERNGKYRISLSRTFVTIDI